MVRNIQLKHSGKYVCMVHTEVDTVSAAADLIVRGTPVPPHLHYLSFCSTLYGGSPCLALWGSVCVCVSSNYDTHIFPLSDTSDITKMLVFRE